MKGTYGTALEWAKLLLSQEPDRDPYCMRLMIHNLALRAHEFRWLLDLYDSQWGRKWRQAEDGHSPAIDHISPSLGFAALQLRDGVKCRELLSDSMKKVPWLFFRLFKEIDLDAPPSIWGIEPRTDAETLFTELYVLQTKDLWNTPEATTLLMEIAHTIPKVDIAKIPTVDNSEMTLDVVRFVYLDNTPALMAMAPSNLLHRSNNSDSDPLPPDENVFSYESQRAQLEGSQSMGGDYNDPLAAMRRLFPDLGNVWQRQRQRGPDDEEVPGIEEEAIQEMIEGAAADLEVPPTVGFLQRLLASMFGRRGDDSDEENEAGTDPDDDMPGLEPLALNEWEDDDGGDDEEEEYFSDEIPPASDDEDGSDDEMPALVPNH